MEKIKIGLGCDYIGFDLKEKIKKYLVEEKCAEVVLDPVKTIADGKWNYEIVSDKICKAIQKDECRLAIMICGTGLGLCCATNKHWGIRSVCVSDAYSAERGRKSNNAQILCFGCRVVGIELAKKIVDAWYDEPFNYTSHSLRSVQALMNFEDQEKKPQWVNWSMGYTEEDSDKWYFDKNKKKIIRK